MANVSFHPEAEDDYRQSLAWYQARSPNSASRFESEVERVLNLIEATPDAYPEYDDRHRFAVLRKYPYSIIYQSQVNQIYVIAFAHSLCKPDYWRNRVP